MHSGPRSVRERNDPSQYDDLVHEWWNLRGPFAMLHWIAASRADLVPPATRAGALLIDLGCGAGLLAPHISGKGYEHIGIDFSLSALDLAREQGISPVRADVGALPLRAGIADVVCAGEILEHVADLRPVIAEACRLLRPGGTIVLDTIANTVLARIVAIEIAERIPGGAPRGIHDSRLFVDRKMLVATCKEHGVALILNGLRPSMSSLIRWWARRAPTVQMVSTRPTSVLFQGVGIKQ